MFLNQERFEDEVLGAAEPVLVDLFQPACAPCRRLIPILDELVDGGYRVCKVDVAERPDLGVRYRISAVPTLVVINNGEECTRFVGFQSAQTLRDALDRASQ